MVASGAYFDVKPAIGEHLQHLRTHGTLHSMKCIVADAQTGVKVGRSSTQALHSHQSGEARRLHLA